MSFRDFSIHLRMPINTSSPYQFRMYDSEYVQGTPVAGALNSLLAELVIIRPEDPIQWLAEQLRNWLQTKNHLNEVFFVHLRRIPF